ncbi:MAG TPA: PKD domain-containing protein [Vicinamibacterales bacterium]|nr:PKD domain-containing protein [Vicinamibacterales bacterium]
MSSIITGRDRSRKLDVWALAASLGILTIACDKMPLLAPSASTIKVSSNSSVVQANGSAEIRATVLEASGTPVQNGTTVTFTTNLGALSPSEARTVNGVATVQFAGNGQSGKAQIKAISGGAASDALELSVGTAAADRVVLTASPNQIASGGLSIITARVTDVGGNALTGVLVSFSTDSGSLSSTNATTSASGEAQVTLSATRDATVTATAGSATAATTKVVVSTLPDITLSASPAAPVEGQPVTFTVTVTGGTSTEAFQSVALDFGDGTSTGALSAGNQSVSHVYNFSGTFTVVATGTAASGKSKLATAVITVTERGLVNVTISKNPSSAVDKNEVVTFTATATGGTPRSYSWTFGDGQSFNGSSQVSHSYSTSGTKTVTVTVSTTDGNSGKGQTQVVVNP